MSADPADFTESADFGDLSERELAELEVALAGEMGALLTGAHEHAAEVMEPRRSDVLKRVRDQVDLEGERQRRRGRRRALRALFYVFNLAAVVMIVVAYVGNRMAIRVIELGERRLATHTEIQAMNGALVRYCKEHPKAPLPQDFKALIAVLTPEGRDPYYPFDSHRLRGDHYLDDFGRPYRYRVGRNDQALIYSVGINGLDEQGEGDDIVARVTFVR